MKNEFRKHGVLIEDIIDSYKNIDEYKMVAKVYLNDTFFEDLPKMIEENDYAMAKDAVKGLYILALDLRMIRLYQELLEVYECLVEEEYKYIPENIDRVLDIRKDLMELVNV